jgi:hypothetical protein
LSKQSIIAIYKSNSPFLLKVLLNYAVSDPVVSGSGISQNSFQKSQDPADEIELDNCCYYRASVLADYNFL